MLISVYDEMNGNGRLSVAEMTAYVEEDTFDVSDRVPGVHGRAFDLKTWHRAWRTRMTGIRNEAGEAETCGQLTEPIYCKVEAADEFQAEIPWDQLDKALFLYAQPDGEPLRKGFPIRLYVPDGSSECLNVKSVVSIHFRYDKLSGNEAAYGFKNIVTPDELRSRR